MTRCTLNPEGVAQPQHPHFVNFYGWLRELADRVAPGRLAPDSDRRVLDEPEERRQCMTAAALQSVNGELICRLGPFLVSILRGERSAVRVMSEDWLLGKLCRSGAFSVAT